MGIIFLMKRKNNRSFKYNNSSLVYRGLKKIGKWDCNLCKKKFDTYSKFDRFCLACNHTEIYRGYFV